LVYVHGCFWHHHQGCRIAHVPKSRSEYWQARFAVNQARDAHHLVRAQAEGWDTLVVWECEVKDRMGLAAHLQSFLGPTKAGRPQKRPSTDSNSGLSHGHQL